MLDEDLELLEKLDHHIARSDGWLGRLVEGDWQVQLLKTIPSVVYLTILYSNP